MIIKDEKTIEKLINIGVFGYDAEKIANITGIKLDEVKKQLADENSQINKLMKKGRDVADYLIDLKLFEQAKNGNIQAMEKLDYRKRIRK